MTATDRLRALLDERGVEHYDGTKTTIWGYEPTSESTGAYRVAADEMSSGRMQVRMFNVTTEQAVEATLGRETCEAREEIVRCRDCRRFSLDNSDHDYRSGWWCHRWNTDMVKPDGFCSWGVARDGATAIETHPGRDELVDYLCDMCANDCDERKVIRVGQGAYDVCERWKEFDHD